MEFTNIPNYTLADTMVQSFAKEKCVNLYMLSYNLLIALSDLTIDGNLQQFQGKHSRLHLCPALLAFQLRESYESTKMV